MHTHIPLLLVTRRLFSYGKLYIQVVCLTLSQIRPNCSLAELTDSSRGHPANEVYVTGTFDNWSKSVQLEKKGDIFEKTVTLPTDKKISYKVRTPHTRVYKDMRRDASARNWRAFRRDWQEKAFARSRDTCSLARRKRYSCATQCRESAS